MLKVTPYLGALVLIVSIGGIFYPKLGFFLPVVFATLLVTGFFKGRWFCGNLCPRGSFNDFWLSKLSMKKGIPRVFRSMWLRVPVVVAMMGFMVYRIVSTEPLVDKIGMVFVTMCLITTALAALLGVYFSPRAWCSFCPMGTIQSKMNVSKLELKVDMQKCVNCRKCQNVCPMHLKVNEILHKPDCIKCGRCVIECPVEALGF